MTEQVSARSAAHDGEGREQDMIENFKQAKEIIDRDPGVEPEIFWRSVGLELQVAKEVGEWARVQANIGGATMSFADAMTILEIGATLAREGIRLQASGGSTRADDPGQEWVRFPAEFWKGLRG